MHAPSAAPATTTTANAGLDLELRIGTSGLHPTIARSTRRDARGASHYGPVPQRAEELEDGEDRDAAIDEPTIAAMNPDELHPTLGVGGLELPQSIAEARVPPRRSLPFESHEPIWRSGDAKKAAEDYPFRVRIVPDLILPAGEAIPAEPIARQMTYVAKWPAQNWTLAFQGNVHEIGGDDYRLIREAIAAAMPIGASVGGG